LGGKSKRGTPKGNLLWRPQRSTLKRLSNKNKERKNVSWDPQGRERFKNNPAEGKYRKRFILGGGGWGGAKLLGNKVLLG